MEIVRALVIYVLVALIAGGIAYLGNWMGRKIGRKKLTVLGMRPRHTSNFVTAVTGSMIAIATLTIFALSSEEARYVLTGIKQLKAELRRLEEDVQHAKESRVVWGVNQPIMHGVLQPGVDPAVQRERILLVLSIANRLTIERNNEIAKENGQPEADIQDQMVTWSDERIDEIANYMRTVDRVEGIRFTAARNALFQDTVPIDMNIIPVKRIFREGEIVASQHLQPDSPELLLQWYAFLEDVRSSAKRRGMIEINDSLGSGLTSEDFNRLVQDMKRLKGPGKIVAVATQDLYQTSTLAIRIEVQPGNGTPKANSIVGRR